MHEIDGQYNDSGSFVDGTPGTTPPVFPTFFTADWCNAVQEELVNVIELAGITLSKSDNVQLAQVVNQSWAVFDITDGSGTPSLVDSLNVDSVNRQAAGRWRVLWDTDFADATYSVLITVGWNDTTATYLGHVQYTDQNTGYVEIDFFNSSHATADAPQKARFTVRASGSVTL